MTVAQFGPTKDSRMQQDAPTVNYGASGSVEEELTFIGGVKTTWGRAILAFDVSSIPAAATINSAKLIREVDTIFGAGNCWVTRITRADWTETGVSWNDYKGGTPWTVAGGDLDTATPAQVGFAEPAATGSHQVTGLLAFVTDAIANRANIVTFVTRMQDEGASGPNRGAAWHSKEGVTDPILEVDYTPPAGGADRRRGRWP